MDQKKLTAAIAAFVCAAALLFCAVSKRWQKADHVDGGFGPRGWSCEGCGNGFDGDLSNDDIVTRVEQLRHDYPYAHIKAPSPLFPRAGWATVFACALAAAGLIWCGVTALRGTTANAAPSVALLGLFFSLIAGAVFIATNPLRDKGVSPVGPSWPLFLWAVTVVGGIVVAQMLAKYKHRDSGDIVL